ncbi:MAG: hypothetical protein WA988_11230, partial [Candidatus Nanopelagicales bacterium]
RGRARERGLTGRAPGMVGLGDSDDDPPNHAPNPTTPQAAILGSSDQRVRPGGRIAGSASASSWRTSLI